MDRENVVKDNAVRGLQSAIEISGAMVHLRKEHAKAILELLKEQDKLLRKLQKDKDKLCLDVSEWKHKYHDRPLKEQEAIIRCKDCKKHGDIACPLWTDAIEWETDDDWFCADAWRRDSYDGTWQAN